jgi:hypothetical protein
MSKLRGIPDWFQVHAEVLANGNVRQIEEMNEYADVPQGCSRTYINGHCNGMVVLEHDMRFVVVMTPFQSRKIFENTFDDYDAAIMCAIMKARQ